MKRSVYFSSPNLAKIERRSVINARDPRVYGEKPLFGIYSQTDDANTAAGQRVFSPHNATGFRLALYYDIHELRMIPPFDSVLDNPSNGTGNVMFPRALLETRTLQVP